LIIEVDGITHESDFAIKRDDVRDRNLKEIGFTVFRFDSGMVLKNMVAIDILLTQWMIDNKFYEEIPPPTPSKGG
jgi:very-short-patch-repair endonuclease